MKRETAIEKGEWMCRSAFASMITRYNSVFIFLQPVAFYKLLYELFHF